MSDSSRLAFHHYPASPFSEKIRVLFGLKGVAYDSVDQPMWLPRPHLTPMTGAFRRIPVLQIGADLYCDTQLIARKVDELFPDPPLYTDATAAAAELTARWADTTLFFQVCVPLVFGALADTVPKELLEDRKKMNPSFDAAAMKAAAPRCRATLAAACDLLERTLGEQPFLLGDAFTLADAAVYHCLWFVRSAPEVAADLGRLENVSAWMARIAELGSGDPTPISAASALEMARRSEPADLDRGPQSATGPKPGTKVELHSEDAPRDVVAGRVLTATDHEIVLERSDPAVGTVALHFPRFGYVVR